MNSAPQLYSIAMLFAAVLRIGFFVLAVLWAFLKRPNNHKAGNWVIVGLLMIAISNVTATIGTFLLTRYLSSSEVLYPIAGIQVLSTLGNLTGLACLLYAALGIAGPQGTAEPQGMAGPQGEPTSLDPQEAGLANGDMIVDDGNPYRSPKS